VVVVVVAGACGGGDDGGTRSGRFAGVHAEVCAALASAADGQLEVARDAFDDVHVGLHDLAVAAGEEDREVAARLLEAKQRVEADLDRRSLAALVAPTAEAVRATGGAAPDTCP
jgi:hypothetical protein